MNKEDLPGEVFSVCAERIGELRWGRQECWMECIIWQGKYMAIKEA
jgi:hypothetical protein